MGRQHHNRSGGSSPYDARFFSATSRRSAESAEAVVPILMELLKPASVLDVGCGGGEWLAAFREQGVEDAYGLDMYATHAAMLLVPRERIATMNLQERFELDRRFDLVLCLEVAEHLPRSAAAGLIESLTRHGDVVVFSAALPGQGGTDHVNEQWLEYWVGLFAQRGFDAFDIVRPLIWKRAEIAPYYRQNMVIFARRAAAPVTRLLEAQTLAMRHDVRSLVHPDTLRYRVAMSDASRGLRYALRALRLALMRILGFAPRRAHPCPEYPPRTHAGEQG